MAALPAVAAAMTAASGVIGAVGAIQQGQAANEAAQFEADQQEMQAKESFAASQRDAEQARREAALVQQRQQAVAAASGGGADDATIVRLMSKVAGEGELNAQSALYQGKSQSRGLMDAAMGSRMSGRASLLGSYLSAAGTLAGSFGKAYEQKKTYG